ncbi:esterase [Alcanivorax sp. S71-1-4]|uniref:tannase/feruloyl esterase family alpha/beta hydrolase n=1 Tax=Alcanivorax sp. S71-1-4 TaxID=1177159 RepID=UPI001357A6CD|nr:tannase/feruloyl esterase family alpha/beta hydrolase [Alcanivorax sp. S71-1-4]KAF0805638.1 esterase [Alcanivorax sp. S71-1-4]
MNHYFSMPGIRFAPLALLPALLSACGGSDSTDKPPVARQEIACERLADYALQQDNVIAASASIAAGDDTIPTHCVVNLTEAPNTEIHVVLPLNALDGGEGGSARGAWNGKVQNQGGGGYVGNLMPVAGPVRNGFVGSVTNAGHSPAWCNALDPDTGLPNSQENCGLVNGGFVLDGNNDLVVSRVQTFIRDSLLAQTEWALDLAEAYYAMPAERNYWTGCSTGGRQGFEMAQQYGDLFDGFLVGAPAMNWNRFIIGGTWPPVVARERLGAAGLDPARSAAANAAAIAACDADDGVVDGVINEPRLCGFNADSLICQGDGPDAATCLTPDEAFVVNAIWDGPRDELGRRLWGGLPKGVSFDTLLPGGVDPSVMMLTYLSNWMYQDPDYDWTQVSEAQFYQHFEFSRSKYSGLAATDAVNLDAVRDSGAKIIHYHGLSDSLIIPYGSYNYVGRVFEHYGQEATQTFMRSFFFPGVGHCAGGAGAQPDTDEMFRVLQDWVEQGVAPDYLVASGAPGNADATRKVCMYPDALQLAAPAAPDDEASYVCEPVDDIPEVLKEDARTFLDE